MSLHYRRGLRNLSDRLHYRAFALWQDLYYTAKLLYSVLSGYNCIVSKAWDCNDGDEEYGYIWQPSAPEDSQYYACLEFGNGRHLPVPLVLGGESGLPMQDFVIAVLMRLGCFEKALKDIHGLWG